MIYLAQLVHKTGCAGRAAARQAVNVDAALGDARFQAVRRQPSDFVHTQPFDVVNLRLVRAAPVTALFAALARLGNSEWRLIRNDVIHTRC